MHADNSTLVVVRREWDGWRTAQVRFNDLQDVHWFQPARAPRPLIHAYIWCSKVVSGEVPHDCAATPAPHRVRVCVLKTHTAPAVYADLTALADTQGLNGVVPNGAHLKAPGRIVTGQFSFPRGHA